MNCHSKIIGLLLSIATLSACQSTQEEISWVEYGDNPMTNPQFMTDMMAAGAPGEEHASMANHVGTWKVDGKFWMVPGGPPMETTGESVIRTIFGGRFLIEDYSSDFAGMPFEGLLIRGYDNIKAEHFTIWMDNFSTGAGIAQGQRGKDGVIHTSAKQFDIKTPVTGRPMRSEIIEEWPDKATFRMYDSLPDGGEFLSMEMVYNR